MSSLYTLKQHRICIRKPSEIGVNLYFEYHGTKLLRIHLHSIAVSTHHVYFDNLTKTLLYPWRIIKLFVTDLYKEETKLFDPK